MVSQALKFGQYYLLLGQVTKLIIEEQAVEIKVFGGPNIKVPLDNDPNFQQTGVLQAYDGSGNIARGSIVCLLTDGDQVYRILKMWAHRNDLLNEGGTIDESKRHRLQEGEVKIESVRSKGRLGAAFFADSLGGAHIYPANAVDFIDFLETGALNIHIDSLSFVTGDGFKIETNSDNTLTISKMPSDQATTTDFSISINADKELIIEQTGTGALVKINKTGQIDLTAAGGDGKIVQNNGVKGVARLDDAVKSTSVEDQKYWAFLKALGDTILGPIVTEPGGGAPSAFQTKIQLAMTTALVAQTPASLTGKITESSDTVMAGD